MTWLQEVSAEHGPPKINRPISTVFTYTWPDKCRVWVERLADDRDYCWRLCLNSSRAHLTVLLRDEPSDGDFRDVCRLAGLLPAAPLASFLTPELAEHVADELFGFANEDADGRGGGLPFWRAVVDNGVFPALRSYVPEEPTTTEGETTP